VAQPIAFDDFRSELAVAFEVPTDVLTPDTDFLYNLGFNSLRMLELGMFFERFGVDMPLELAWDIRTVGNAYDYYVRELTEGATGVDDRDASDRR
jgi:acyl carrier protein